MKYLLILFMVLTAVSISATERDVTQDNSVIREGQIWEYIKTTGVPGMYRIWLKFEGSETIEDKEYSKLHVVRKEFWDRLEDTVIDRLENDSDVPVPPILLREENGHVYRYIYNDYYYNPNYSPKTELSLSPCKEILLMDYSSEIGNSFSIWASENPTIEWTYFEGDGEEWIRNLILVETEDIEVNGVNRKLLIYALTNPNYPMDVTYTLKAIETIGPISYETYGGTIAMVCQWSPTPGMSFDGNYEFNRLLSESGEELFRNSFGYYDWDKMTSEVRLINTEGATNPLHFNLQGQRIAEPKPGDVVIRVCGDRREKIVMP